MFEFMLKLIKKKFTEFVTFIIYDKCIEVILQLYNEDIDLIFKYYFGISFNLDESF